MTMVDYIYEQDEVYNAMLTSFKENAKEFASFAKKENVDSYYIVASGTSRNAASAASYFMERVLKAPVTVVSSSSSGLFHGSKPLAIYISQGGMSTNTIAAIKKNKGILSVAMTGNKNGLVNSMCDRYIEIPCGEESAGPKTKGYTSTILALYMMALETGRKTGSISEEEYESCYQNLDAAGKALRANIDTCFNWEKENSSLLTSFKTAYVVAKGCGKAVAEEGALKVMETYILPSIGFEFEEYLHGPSCSIDKGIAGFYILPDADDEDYERILKVADYHKGLEEAVFTIGGKKSSASLKLEMTAWYTLPFEAILPLQVISAICPGRIGIEGEGMKRFKAIDKAVGVKAAKEGA